MVRRGLNHFKMWQVSIGRTTGHGEDAGAGLWERSWFLEEFGILLIEHKLNFALNLLVFLEEVIKLVYLWGAFFQSFVSIDQFFHIILLFIVLYTLFLNLKKDRSLLTVNIFLHISTLLHHMQRQCTLILAFISPTNSLNHRQKLTSLLHRQTPIPTVRHS